MLAALVTAVVCERPRVRYVNRYTHNDTTQRSQLSRTRFCFHCCIATIKKPCLYIKQYVHKHRNYSLAATVMTYINDGTDLIIKSHRRHRRRISSVNWTSVVFRVMRFYAVFIFHCPNYRGIVPNIMSKQVTSS